MRNGQDSSCGAVSQIRRGGECIPCLPAVALLQSRSKSAPSAKLEKVALRRRQPEALLSPSPAHLIWKGVGRQMTHPRREVTTLEKAEKIGAGNDA
jgi:hypothetical protein